MARFRSVDLYPFTGFPDRLWDSAQYPADPVRDAVLRAAPPVTALYTAALREVDVSGPRAWLMISVTQRRSDDTVELAVWRREPPEGPEQAFVTLCPDVGLLDARGRARLVLDVVHAGVVALAEVRGWDAEVFDACREHVVVQGFTYRWASPWRSSPDRRHQARATYTLGEPDGFGRTRLEVRRRGAADAGWTSAQATAFCHAPSFPRSAATLTWDGSQQVGFEPYVGGGGHRGSVTGRRRDDTWSFDVDDRVTLLTPGDGLEQSSAAPVPAVVTTLT